MPAEFTFYKLKKPETTILYESPDKTYIIFKNIHDIYNSDDLKNATIIGQSTAIINKILNETDVVTSATIFRKFNEYAGVPYGDDNILVTSSTQYNKFDKDGKVIKDGNYIECVASDQSTGEYANQVGYLERLVDSVKGIDKFKVVFPLPILTYTNAFNSLPQQPSTAPLPA
jgi:hypothetical protein